MNADLKLRHFRYFVARPRNCTSVVQQKRLHFVVTASVAADPQNRRWFLFSSSIANSRLACECGSRTTGRIGLIPEVHGCDKTAVHSEDVENFTVR